MAGQTDNTDILAGLNQTIQAINDLILSSTCTPQVNVTCDGTGGGTQGPSDGGTQGDTPPDGWSEPPDPPADPGYWTRKCKVANAIHESLVDWLTLWETYEVDGYTSAFLTIALISLLGALAGEIATPVPLIDGVIGFIIGFLSGVAIAIINGGFNLTSILSLMSTYEQNLVCALYDATTTQDAIDDYLQVLDDNGASAGDLLLLRAVVVIDLLNNLFFKRGDAVDDALASYSAPLSCGGCGGCPDYLVFYGNVTSFTQTHLEMSSEWSGSYHICSLAFHVTGSPYFDNVCGPECTFTLTSIPGHSPASGVTDFKMNDSTGASVYLSDTPPTVVNDVIYFIFYSAASFSTIADLVFE